MKRFLMKRVLLVVIMVLAFAAVVLASTVTLTWNAPTTWSDGSPLTTITGYNIYYGNTHSGPYPNQIPVSGTATTASISSMADGTWYFVATTLATNLTGSVVESAWSNEATKIIDNRRPGAPTNTTVVSVTLI